jgi:hypothetical protein
LGAKIVATTGGTMLREKIAQIIAKVRYDISDGQYKGSEHYVDQVFPLFRAEIEKLGVISDEEIEAHLDRSGTLVERGGYIAQAQLTKTKEDLLKTLEGK